MEYCFSLIQLILGRSQGSFPNQQYLADLSRGLRRAKPDKSPRKRTYYLPLLAKEPFIPQCMVHPNLLLRQVDSRGLGKPNSFARHVGARQYSVSVGRLTVQQHEGKYLRMAQRMNKQDFPEILETERLVLRCYRSEDAEALFKMVQRNRHQLVREFEQLARLHNIRGPSLSRGKSKNSGMHAKPSATASGEKGSKNRQDRSKSRTSLGKFREPSWVISSMNRCTGAVLPVKALGRSSD